MLARLALSGKRPRGATSPQRLLFLVPAHNEELLLADTLSALRAMSYPADRMHIVVVADNCDDGTADVARRSGVECLERFDSQRRGKPWAIAWAVEQLPLERFDAMVIIDADSLVEPTFAQALSDSGPLRSAAAQTFNDVRNARESALTRMAGVFSVVRCAVMNGLKSRVGLNVPFGNGLCVGTDVLRRLGWPAFSICEDWELYAILTAEGVSIANAPAARVMAQEARSLRQSSTQRERWAAGKFHVLLDQLPVIFRSARISWHAKLDAAAELTALGPAVTLGLTGVLIALLAALQPPAALVVIGLLLLPVLRLVVYTGIAVAKSPEPLRTIGAFAFLPFYTVWRVAIQLRVFRPRRSRSWIRTARHVETVDVTMTR